MSNRTQRQLTSGRISDALDAPPYPVVCQNGSFYALGEKLDVGREIVEELAR